MNVASILRTKGADVATATPGTKVSEIAQRMKDKRIGALVVSQDGKRAQGILSERDIVRELGRAGGACLERTVADYMTRNVITTTAQSSVSEVLTQMTEGRFRHMPVMDGEAMVGLISLGDVVKAQLQKLEMEKDALEGMIMGH